MPSSSPPPFGLLDLLAAALAAVFVVGGLLAVAPWLLRLTCLLGSVLGFGVGWRLTRRRSWNAKLLVQPLGALLGFAAGGLAWIGHDTLGLLLETKP